jgi:hypothetical protein
VYCALKSEVLPSFFLILLGFIDCLTTAIGVSYFGAIEINPLMASIISANMMAYLALKISATFLIGFTFFLAKRALHYTLDKSTKVFQYSTMLIKWAYVGLILFLIAIVTNNLIVLIA